jgi:antitoxin VapB
MLNIKNPETDELARRLAGLTGRNLTDAVTYALREQLRRETGKSSSGTLADELMEIGRRCASLPILDRRTDEEILGYNATGTWS